MAGTGKSQVIKALIHFFNERDEGYKLLCMASTGTAAALIGGSTYHSLLDINRNKTQDSALPLKQVCARLQNVDYIFMDEISMVDCGALYNICAHMCMVLKNDGTPFGGINMIFAGDFAQLPPAMQGSALYSHTGG